MSDLPAAVLHGIESDQKADIGSRPLKSCLPLAPQEHLPYAGETVTHHSVTGCNRSSLFILDMKWWGRYANERGSNLHFEVLSCVWGAGTNFGHISSGAKSILPWCRGRLWPRRLEHRLTHWKGMVCCLLKTSTRAQTFCLEKLCWIVPFLHTLLFWLGQKTLQNTKISLFLLLLSVFLYLSRFLPPPLFVIFIYLLFKNNCLIITVRWLKFHKVEGWLMFKMNRINTFTLPLLQDVTSAFWIVPFF